MRQNLLTNHTRLHHDQSVVVVGFGAFGRTVAEHARQEFGRLGVPGDRFACLAFDPAVKAARGDGDPAVALPAFQARDYIGDAANESLCTAVAHAPVAALDDAAAQSEREPTAALVTFHRWDETTITQRLRATVDSVRSANPDGRITCVVVAALGSGTTTGMAIPFLFRVHDHLRMRNVGLHVVFVTPDARPEAGDASGTPVQGDDAARNAAAAAMLWEHVQRGDTDIVYPGKSGVREDKTFRGPIADRTWVFSAGTGSATHSEAVVASIVASALVTLLRTPLGAALESERSDYGETVLEHGWRDARGVAHPTQLAAMNVGGLKLDCFPAIFHLRAARAFLDEVTRTLPPEREAAVRDTVDDCLADARLYDDAIVEDLGVGARPVTREEIAAAKLSQDALHAWLSQRLEDDVGRLVTMANGRHDPGPTEVLLDRARLAISVRAAAIANSPEGYLPGAIVFYRALQKRLETARASVLHRADLARNELGTTPNRDRLNVLLERLQRDTAPPSSRFGIIERFVSTITVSVPTQVRKILEVATEIRGHAQIVAAGTVLATVYDKLAHFCETQREELQGRLYQLNNAAAQSMRDEELIQRSARAAFTYQRARFEPLIEHLCVELRRQVPMVSTADVIARVGGDLPGFAGREARLLDGVLAAVQVDAAGLAHATDGVFATDPAVRDALKESLAQFVPIVHVDRDHLGAHTTARLRFVLCTQRVYDAHREDVFEGYRHIATDDPYDILCTDHEDGLPFAALVPMRRAHATYRALVEEGRAAAAHPTAELAAALTPLDA
jgi:hypothetical protein